MTTPAREAIVTEIGKHRVSAILRTDNEETAARAMAAAVEGGFRMIEFTLTTPGAWDLITEYSNRDGFLVGAGTVLTPAEAERAVSAGAKFLVSPVVDPEVIKAAGSMDVVSIPGTSTATEIWTAHRSGADIAKIFPAPANLPRVGTQIRGPLPGIKLVPTAGVSIDNFMEVLEAGAFGVGFVAPLFAPADLKAGNYDAIRDRARTIMERLG
jgi:2-dehydro-3-deoxyphosphogluconate aldolase/(4S)-4-hydroxy-2-oxoglutarate aldolase